MFQVSRPLASYFHLFSALKTAHTASFSPKEEYISPRTRLQAAWALETRSIFGDLGALNSSKGHQWLWVKSSAPHCEHPMLASKVHKTVGWRFHPQKGTVGFDPQPNLHLAENLAAFLPFHSCTAGPPPRPWKDANAGKHGEPLRLCLGPRFNPRSSMGHIWGATVSGHPTLWGVATLRKVIGSSFISWWSKSTACLFKHKVVIQQDTMRRSMALTVSSQLSTPCFFCFSPLESLRVGPAWSAFPPGCAQILRVNWYHSVVQIKDFELWMPKTYAHESPKHICGLSSILEASPWFFKRNNDVIEQVVTIQAFEFQTGPSAQPWYM